LTSDLDPQLVELVASIPIGTVDAGTLEGLRRADFGAPAELSERVERTDHVVDASTGVTVRVHRPAGAAGPLPCLYSMHGGGFVFGTNAIDDARFDSWCPRFGLVGVSVDYRLAPETPYPGPLDDCYAGLRWVWAHHEEIGVDPDQIALVGVSAGGGLAAGLALMARDRGEVPILFQLLECPMLDDRQVSPSSRLEGLAIWNRHSNEFGWRSYLGPLYGTSEVPAYAAPARATDLAGLPPAYICVGTADGFRDEDIDYATRLNQAGVPAELHVYAGAPHGVGVFAGTALADRYNRDLEEWLAARIGGYAAQTNPSTHAGPS
jgi:acetyl esterase/lipase